MKQEHKRILRCAALLVAASVAEAAQAADTKPNLLVIWGDAIGK